MEADFSYYVIRMDAFDNWEVIATFRLLSDAVRFTKNFDKINSGFFRYYVINVKKDGRIEMSVE